MPKRGGPANFLMKVGWASLEWEASERSVARQPLPVTFVIIPTVPALLVVEANS
jgi:hypothetical protein